MSETQLRRAMADLLDGEPAKGVDPQLALRAGRSARRERHIKVGLTGVLVAGTLGLAGPVAISQLTAQSHVAPGLVGTPSPTLSGIAADLVFGDALVRADPERGRAFVIIRVSNAGARRIGLAGIVHSPPGGGVSRGLRDETFAPEATVRQVMTVPPAKIPEILAGAGDSAQNVVLDPGDDALLIVTVERDCTVTGSVPAGIVDLAFAEPGVRLLQVPPGADVSFYRLVDAPAAPPTWLAAAWSASCPSAR
jgi:hypothetical protein